MNPVELSKRLTRTAALCATLLALAEPARAQGLDICGCAGSPASLGAFNTQDPATWPAGTQSAFRSLLLPLPASGVLIFNSVNLAPRTLALGGISDSGVLVLSFQRNAANTPVTILVSGNVTIGSGVTLSVVGLGGTYGTLGLNGTGGLGGPGGFRGGDGAYQSVNFASQGGDGSGPGGGRGDDSDAVISGGGGVFVGNVELRPLLGGSGGGGGSSNATTSGCSGGGGAGGGGAILIAANGTLTVTGVIDADGGFGGSPYDPSCSSYSGGGSGGAIRLIADTLAGAGSLDARGASNATGLAQGRGTPGRIRLEAITNNLPGTAADPVAVRSPAPGPIVNPLVAGIAIIEVNGAVVPNPPQGGFGEVDLILPAPGPVTFDLETNGVPTGTNVEVTIKPRVATPPSVVTVVQPVTLTAGICDPTGRCFPSATVDLAAGAYTAEARATFQTP